SGKVCSMRRWAANEVNRLAAMTSAVSFGVLKFIGWVIGVLGSWRVKLSIHFFDGQGFVEAGTGDQFQPQFLQQNIFGPFNSAVAVVAGLGQGGEGKVVGVAQAGLVEDRSVERRLQ